MSATENESFEKSLEMLRKCAAELRSGELDLDDSVKVYEKSIMYYNKCSEFLQSAKQKVELYNPVTGETEVLNGVD